MMLFSRFIAQAHGERSVGAARSIRWVAGVGLAMLVAWPGSATVPGLYTLAQDSSYQEGCFPPCMCPLTVAQPVQGTFVLQLANSDPLFAVYALTDVRWRIVRDGAETEVTGAGAYRVGGEVAVMQQLTLDLQVGSDPVAHFDSGLVAGGGAFPDLAAVVSMNGMFCYDRVFRVHAQPAQALPQHAVFALVRGSSSVELSLFTGGAQSPLYGTLRLFLGDPAVAVSPLPGVVGVSVESADLFAPELLPVLPGMSLQLRMAENPALPSVGAWNMTTGEVDLDLHLIAPDGNLPVPMPVHLRGKLLGAVLTVEGDNGSVPDATLALTIRAFRLRVVQGVGQTVSTPE